jgi:dipeptidyl aminopeptidase/acylaminoacyl peptidase
VLINAATYDSSANTLSVELQSNAKVTHYDVPEYAYVKLMRSADKAHYYRQNIQRNYGTTNAIEWAELSMVPVNSKVFDAAHYDKETELLSIMLNGGEVIQHEGVPEKIYAGFMDAKIKGSYYTGRIKDNYRDALAHYRDRELQSAQEGTFEADFDGSTQRYLVRLPRNFNPNDTHDLLIAFHGHGQDRFQMAEHANAECKGIRDFASKHNMIFVSPDYRAPASWMNAAAEADTIQLIAKLKKLYQTGKTYLVGASMGGTGVMTFTALHPELVDGLCSMNGTANLLEYDVNYSDIQEAIKISYGGKIDETPADYKKRNRHEYVKRSAEFQADTFRMPLAIALGGKDTIVPPGSMLRLAEAITRHNPNVLLLHRPNQTHRTSYRDTLSALEFITGKSR